MKLELLYFAALRERVGVPRELIDVGPDVATVGQLRQHLAARGEPWSSALAPTRRVRAAVNQTMADDDTALPADAEIAFFPPVTGG